MDWFWLDPFKQFKSLMPEYGIKESEDFAERCKETRQIQKQKCVYQEEEVKVYLPKILREIGFKILDWTVRYKKCPKIYRYRSEACRAIAHEVENLLTLYNVASILSEDANQKKEMKYLAKFWRDFKGFVLGIIYQCQDQTCVETEVIWRRAIAFTRENIFKEIIRSGSTMEVLEENVFENKQQESVIHHVQNLLRFRGNQNVTLRNPCPNNITTTQPLRCDMSEFIDKEKQKIMYQDCMKAGVMSVNKHFEMSGDTKNHKGCRIYGYNWKVNLFVVVFCMSALSGDCSSHCAYSRQTRLTVDKCPENETAWIAAANKKDCSAVNQTCTSKENFVYHCLLGTEENTLVEVCAVQQIYFRSCPYFSDYGATLDRRKQQRCNTCKTIYRSNEVYKHRECYRTQMTKTMEPLSQTHPDANSEQISTKGVVSTVPNPVRPEKNNIYIQLPVSISSVLVPVVTLIVIYWCLRRHKRNIRNTNRNLQTLMDCD